jgi:hypothetical protein
LYGSEFSVYCHTDHCPRQHFLTQSNLSAGQLRWQQYLSESNIAISYVPGKVDVFADGLSRRPDLRFMMIGALGGVHQFLREICEGVQKSRLAKKCWNEARAANKTSKTPYKLLHSVLYYEYMSLIIETYVLVCLKCIIPPLLLVILVLKSVIVLHWRCMRDDMKAYIKSCPICQIKKLMPQPVPPVAPFACAV